MKFVLANVSHWAGQVDWKMLKAQCRYIICRYLSSPHQSFAFWQIANIGNIGSLCTPCLCHQYVASMLVRRFVLLARPWQGHSDVESACSAPIAKACCYRKKWSQILLVTFLGSGRADKLLLIWQIIWSALCKPARNKCSCFFSGCNSEYLLNTSGNATSIEVGASLLEVHSHAWTPESMCCSEIGEWVLWLPSRLWSRCPNGSLERIENNGRTNWKASLLDGKIHVGSVACRSPQWIWRRTCHDHSVHVQGLRPVVSVLLSAARKNKKGAVTSLASVLRTEPSRKHPSAVMFLETIGPEARKDCVDTWIRWAEIAPAFQRRWQAWEKKKGVCCCIWTWSRINIEKRNLHLELPWWISKKKGRALPRRNGLRTADRADYKLRIFLWLSWMAGWIAIVVSCGRVTSQALKSQIPEVTLSVSFNCQPRNWLALALNCFTSIKAFPLTIKSVGDHILERGNGNN